MVLHGPRQAGKTTILRSICEATGRASATLDRPEDLAAAASDPRTFLAQLGPAAAIDEIQRGGDDLLLSIKERVDRSQDRGQYLLTGSTNFLTVPTLSETLAGRVDIVPVWPLSVGERLGGADDLVDRVFEEGPTGLLDHSGATPERGDYLDLCALGGFPEVSRLPAAARRRWFSRYAETVIQREVLTAADLRRGDALSALVRYCAATTATETVTSTIAGKLGLDRATVESYLAWIETVFLVHRIPAWTRSPTGRVVRRSKLFVVDSGLAAALTGASSSSLARLGEPRTGPLLETFVAAELAKQLTWSDVGARLHHLREDQGAAVDFILEADDGRIVAIEVKASATPRPEDARWLAVLRDRLDRVGGDFIGGVVLHTGDRRASFGDRIAAVPIADLWT